MLFRSRRIAQPLPGHPKGRAGAQLSDFRRDIEERSRGRGPHFVKYLEMSAHRAPFRLRTAGCRRLPRCSCSPCFTGAEPARTGLPRFAGERETSFGEAERIDCVSGSRSSAVRPNAFCASSLFAWRQHEEHGRGVGDGILAGEISIAQRLISVGQTRLIRV